MVDKVTEYRARAEECRLKAIGETSAEARIYYEALQRDFEKLAAKARGDAP